MKETPTPPTLTPLQRSELRARAHHLDPVVMVGEAGLTDAVLAEADRALAAHGLIKIRILGDDRDARAELMRRVCDALGCAPVQAIGKLLVVWRPRAEEPGKPAGGRRRNEPYMPKKAAAVKRTGRPAPRTRARRRAP